MSKLNFTAMAVSLFVFIGVVQAQAQATKPFYEGKTLNIVVASGPGASTDIGARLVGRFLGKHIPGNPNTLVQNMPGAGGLVAANQIYNLSQTGWSDDLSCHALELSRSNGR